MKVERYSTYIALGLVVLIIFWERLLGYDIIWNFISTVANGIFNALFTLFSSIFY
jgi:hypothetical protein